MTVLLLLLLSRRPGAMCGGPFQASNLDNLQAYVRGGRGRTRVDKLPRVVGLRPAPREARGQLPARNVVAKVKIAAPFRRDGQDEPSQALQTGAFYPNGSCTEAQPS